MLAKRMPKIIWNSVNIVREKLVELLLLCHQEVIVRLIPRYFCSFYKKPEIWLRGKERETERRIIDKDY